MKKKLLFYVTILLFCLPLTGCKLKVVTPLYTMTEDEEAAVVTYAAKVVGKYNALQGDGLRRVYKWQIDKLRPVEEPEEEEQTEEETPEEEEGVQNEDGSVTYSDGRTVYPNGMVLNAAGEVIVNPTDGSEAVAPAQADAAATQAPSASVNDILGIGNINIKYNGFTLGANYKEGDYLSLTPSSGNKYLIMHFSLENPAAEGVYVDILSKHPTFSLSVDGAQGVRNSSTILLYDLTTLQSTLPAGSTTEAVLLFEIPKDSGSEASNLVLQMTVNDNLYNVVLN